MQSTAEIIKKLGHDIEEIRVRALNNILMKLNCHVLTVEDLTESHELFIKLINWFKFPVCTEKEKVLELILTLAKTETGRLKFLEIDPRLKFLRDFDITASERKLSTLISSIIFALEYTSYPPNGQSKVRKPSLHSAPSSGRSSHSEKYEYQFNQGAPQLSNDDPNDVKFTSSKANQFFNQKSSGHSCGNVKPHNHPDMLHADFSSSFHRDKYFHTGCREEIHVNASCRDYPVPPRNMKSHTGFRNEDSPLRNDFTDDISTHNLRTSECPFNFQSGESSRKYLGNERPQSNASRGGDPAVTNTRNENPPSYEAKKDTVNQNYGNSQEYLSHDFSRGDPVFRGFEENMKPMNYDQHHRLYPGLGESVSTNLRFSPAQAKPSQPMSPESRSSSSVHREDVSSKKQKSDPVIFSEPSASVSERPNLYQQNRDARLEAEPFSARSSGSSKTAKSKSSIEEIPAPKIDNDLWIAKDNLGKFESKSSSWRSSSAAKPGEPKNGTSIADRESPLPYQSPESFQLNDFDAEVFKVCSPKWQTLILSDYHVLSAVSQSLKDPSLVDHSCHFFMTVLIRDFPAPVFIQHSSILKSLLWLLKSKSSSSKAIIACLDRLVSSFIQYSNFTDNPGTVSTQTEFDDVSSSSPASGIEGGDRNLNQQEADNEDLCNVKSEQISIPQLCSLIALHLTNHISEVCNSVHLFRSALKLFISHLVCDPKELWTSTNIVAIDCCQHFNTFMVESAVAYKTWAGDSFKQLRLIASVCEFLDNLVPVSIATRVVPELLQEILSHAILDPILLFLYPKLHGFICQYGNIFQKSEISVYNELTVVKESMSSASIFLQSGLTMPISDALQNMSAALLSIPFHLKFELIRSFIYFCSQKIISNKEDMELSIDITLKLLANGCSDIRSFMYSECHKLITSKLGVEQAVKSSDPVPHLKFLLNSEVISEIALYGVFDDIPEIQEEAKDLLIHILSCRLLVPKYSFKTVLSAIGPVLPLLECLAEKNTELGRCVLGVLNPDSSPLSQLQLLTGNLRLMFRNDTIVREEGIARVMWLMRTTTVVEQASGIFIVEKPAHQRQILTGVYEAGSMIRVLELLTAPCVEDRLRRSALIQLSVMTEDWRLHDIFLEQNGLKAVIDVLKNEIEEPRTDSGRDMILSTICVLKNIVRHNTHLRLELSTDFEVYKAAFLGLFKYHDELRLRRDATELFALLLFAEQILTPTIACISVVDLVKRSVILPFELNSHAKSSPHSEPQLTGLLSDENCKKCLSIHWHIVSSSGRNINSLIENYDDVNSDRLVVSEKTMFQLQSASLPFSITQLLYAIQNATHHTTVIETLDVIARYLEMYWLITAEELNEIPLRASVERFLSSPPSNAMDQELLVIVLKFIAEHSLILRHHLTWLPSLLCDERNALSKLVVSHIGNDSTLTKWKEICIEVFHLSRKCVQLFRSENWTHITNNIEKCLRFSHTQHFYNLAFLDALLSCFVEITIASPSQPIDSTELWELISAFHCSNPQSFMGLSVTRNTLILLNHLFHCAVRCKRWEDVWLVESRMIWFPLLFASRDVIVRASAFQLASGLTSSRAGAEFMLTAVDGLWSTSLGVLMNHREASVVRENAGMICSNIISHGTKELMVDRCKEIGLFEYFSVIVAQLRISPLMDSTQEGSPTTNEDYAPTTPDLLKVCCLLLMNLCCLKETTLRDAYQDGFTVSLFRFLSSFQVPNNLSRDVVTMLTAMCSLLAHTMNKVENILVPNCSVAILPLLNTDLFGENLTLERDALWGELWFFISTIPSSSSTLVNLNPPAISALLYSLSSSNRTLQMNALVAVRALSPSFNRDTANELTVSLLVHWDVFSSGSKRLALYSALGQLFMDWGETSVCALKHDFGNLVLFRLKKIHVDLSVAAPDILRSKKNHPTLTHLIDLLGLLSNFLASSELVKNSMAENGLAAVFHNLWVWCSLNSNLFQRYLEVLCTFTADSPDACHSFVSSTIICGKTPRSPSLLHALISYVISEESFSVMFQAALTVLSHCCQSKQCRLIISKNQVTSSITKIAGKKKLNEDFDSHWLRFFCCFSSFYEGQISLIQLPNFFESIVTLANHSKQSIRTLALNVLMNLAFCHPNQSKIVSDDKVLLMLSGKLDRVTNLSKIELKYIAATTWVLAANCQKAKLSMKRVALHSKLQAAAGLVVDDDIIKLLEKIAALFLT
nr:PREDICTED: rotatin isoform X1 [Bemisia tabaci]